MKARKISFVVMGIFTLVIFLYFAVCFTFFVSESYNIMEGFSVDSSIPPGIYAEEVVPVSDSGAIRGKEVVSNSTSKKVTLKVLNVIPIKQVTVNTVKNVLLYPAGECIGIKMYSRGLIVTGFSDFASSEGMCVSPGLVAGLKTGDVIVSANNIPTSSVKQLTEIADSIGTECVLGVLRGSRAMDIKATPMLCTDGHMRFGIMVKNSIAGVGTMTYVSSDNHFAALGHGVTDTDTGVVIPLQSGTLYKSEILNIVRGEKGKPGEMAGAIDDRNLIGECTHNSTGGIFGVLSAYSPHGDLMPAASRNEIIEGKATILCTLENNKEPCEFDVKILSVNRVGKNKTKSFSLQITDEELLKKTGGIIQGMSGSPIIQNGKIVGAVTHVFVNDPTRGYGIFIENMLAEAEKIK